MKHRILIVEDEENLLHGVVTFMAGLELSKRHQVELRQSEPFEELWLYRRRELNGEHENVEGSTEE